MTHVHCDEKQTPQEEKVILVQSSVVMIFQNTIGLNDWHYRMYVAKIRLEKTGAGIIPR